MDEETLAITPFKAPGGEKFGVRDPSSIQRRCVEVAPRRPHPIVRGLSRADTGITNRKPKSNCSGAAFAVAWFKPNDFRKVITVVGSDTDLRGEYIDPELVAASEKKPIRIFMQDGRNDNRPPDRPNGDWFLQNVRLMNALTKKGYDVNYAWGMNNHGQKMGGAIFHEMTRWLWRDQPVSTDPNDMVERSFGHPGAATNATAVKPAN